MKKKRKVPRIWKPPDIPELNVPKCPKNDGKIIDPKWEFLRIFRGFSNRWDVQTVWNDFITLFACSLSNAADKRYFNKREQLYLNTIRKYNQDEQSLFPTLAAYITLALEQNPEQDFLGSMFMELNLENQRRGQVFTPYDISRLMAVLSIGNLEQQINENGIVTICDLCCGAGSLLIAEINEVWKRLKNTNLDFQNYILVVGQDIDFIVALMCYIQISLLGVAGYIKVGDALTEPIANGDSLENYWFTPVYFSDIWTYRRAMQYTEDLVESDEYHAEDNAL